MTSDSTSEAARERKTRALSVRSELTTLSRKQSLMIRILALIDGHCRAMRAVLLEVQVGSRRMRLASSAWKDSSFCKRVEFKIHVSAPNSRHGNTQSSTMLLEERGFKVPWKTPLPLAKKARLAFLMFSSIHLVHDRLGDHNAPKHLAEVVRGNCKDPLLPGSYRGISLTSVIAKTFEYLLLDRMLPVLSDNCVPHLNQTAYQRGVSSTDATFSCQETISKFIRDGDSIYSCFYDLASAFDTVEYPVLLSHLKRAGVSGKAWRLIKDWYTNVSSSVRVGRQASPSFSVSRGVRQGSVLSPTLFLMVMDPILLELNKRSCGPSVCGLYLGAFSHADDIRTLSTNIYDCKLQMTLVSEYASSQGLALNVDKCEASISPSLPVDSTHIHTGDFPLPL